MRKVNIAQLDETSWASPKGTFLGSSRNVSIELGRNPASTDLLARHPFDVEILRIAPGKRPYPYHAHSAQWEFYLVLSGRGLARDADGTTEIAADDAFVYKPGEAHAFENTGTEDLVIQVIADNPFGDACYYPDSGKWSVHIPERRLVRSEALDYYDGEE